jgi:hypothetical protein
MPDLTEALSWIGFRVDDVYGARVGKVEDIYVDHDRGKPYWILAKMGRFSDAHALIPLQDAVAGAGHVWVPYEKDLIRRAPQIAIGAPVAQEREAMLCAHYGVMSSRGAEIASIPPTALTALSSASVRTGLPPMSRTEQPPPQRQRATGS